MSILEAENISLHYPVHNLDSQSLRSHLVNISSGGIIKRQSRNIVIVEALRNVSFNLEAGDRVGLIGKNGAGKTTLLKVLAGIYEPTHGRVKRNGRISTLFDIGLGMDENESGYENIRLTGTLMGMSSSEIESYIPEIEDFSELGEFLSMPLRTYSSGMRVRLGFSIATITGADILLIDEIFGAGDIFFEVKAKSRIEELMKRSKVMVFASHSNSLIRNFCNKGMLFHKGELILFDSIDSAINKYETDELI